MTTLAVTRQGGLIRNELDPHSQRTLATAMVIEAIGGTVFGLVLLRASQDPWYAGCTGDDCNPNGDGWTRAAMIVLAAAQFAAALVMVALLARALRGRLRDPAWAGALAASGFLRLLLSQATWTHPGFHGASLIVIAVLCIVEVVLGLVALRHMKRALSRRET